MISEQLNKALSGIAGEYFAAAELSRHGLVAAVTLRNTRGIDIVVSRAGKNGSATVQVKTVQNGPAKWLLNKSDEKSKGPNHYYVFVVLHGRKGQPEYWVVEGKYVAKYCRDNHRKWLSKRRRDGGPRKNISLRKSSPEKRFHDDWDCICKIKRT
jgi:hypothetical protein